MPVAPRQGRKGGKVSSSPLVQPSEGSPSALSPGTLVPGIGNGTSTDESSGLHMSLETLLDIKKRSDAEAADATGGDKPEAVTLPTVSVKSAPTESNVFKFHVDALQKVCQGVVIGGSKKLRTGLRKPEFLAEDVAAKVQKILSTHAPLPRSKKNALYGPRDILADSDVIIVRRAQEALQLAVEATTCGDNVKVLVVVATFSDVSLTANELLQTHGEGGGAPLAVGELYGQIFVGESNNKLWVASAEAALLYLASLHSLSPFTHVVLPGFTRMTPLISYFLWQLRQHMLSSSSQVSQWNDVASTRSVKLVLRAEVALRSCCESIFKRSVVSVDLFEKSTVEIFSYDEACALAEMDVLEVEEGMLSLPVWQLQKLFEHASALAVKIVMKLLRIATCPQYIYVLTAEASEMSAALKAAQLPNTTVYVDYYCGEQLPADRSTHCIHVTDHITSTLQSNSGAASFILDLGTTTQPSQKNRSEMFIAASSTTWVSLQEIEERQEILGLGLRGGYFQLYPMAAKAAFPRKAPLVPSMTAVEDAVLQSLRTRLPASIPAGDAIIPVDEEVMQHVMHNFADKCLVSNMTDRGITFLGEMAARLPLEVDLAHFVINGCTLGMGEVVVVLASIGATLIQAPSEVCTKYAGALAQQSDLLANALVFLEWAKSKARGEVTAQLVEEIHVKEYRLGRVQLLMHYLCVQLSDYVFLDDLGDLATLEAVEVTLKANATLLIFLESVSLARRVAFVREDDLFQANDQSSSLVFVRSSKKVVPNTTFSSNVSWEKGSALIPVHLQNFPTIITGSAVTALRSSYFFASLLLLYPQVEYSSPVETAGMGRMVYFGVTCNRQMKRFRVSVEEAACILDFREKWNTALGCLQALRTMKRPVSRTRFALELKAKDRTFDLQRLQQDIQMELLRLATELEVSEHQGSFTTLAIHFVAPTEVVESSSVEEASDLIMMKRFHMGQLWMQGPSRSQSPMAAVVSPASPFPQAAVVVEEDDDDVEVLDQCYFLTHGPILDDDDTCYTVDKER